MNRILGRIRHRKVVEWSLAYLAGSWLALQVVDVLADMWAWPPMLGQALTVLLTVGLLIAIVIAWYHGERGAQRVTGPELIMIAVLCTIAGGLLTLIGSESEAMPSADLAVATSEEGSAEDTRPSIAVLPFDNISPNPDDAYFEDGIHEEVTSQLARIGSLKVISRTSAMAYRGATAGVPEIASQLDAQFLLEGSVRKDGDRIRLTAQLIDGRSDDHLWTETYDRDLTDIFEIQTDLAIRIASDLQATLTQDERLRILDAPTSDVEAFTLYLQGRYFWNRRTAAGNARARVLFERAVQLDPEFALAHVGLADASLTAMFVTASVERAAHAATVEDALRVALELDPSLGEAHASLGILDMFYRWDSEAALENLRQAVELSPNYAQGRAWYGNALSFSGAVEEGLAEVRVALTLDPVSPNIAEAVSQSLIGAGRVDEGLDELRRAIELDPDYWRAWFRLGLYHAAEQPDSAAADLLGAWSHGAFGATGDEVVRLRAAYEAGGFQALLEAKGEQLEARHALGGAWAVEGMIVAALSGDHSRTVEWLRRAVEQGSLGMAFNYTNVFEESCNDPEFRSRLAEAGALEYLCRPVERRE